jgi:putative spermidine/putrescine transport system substrate-binding protein
MPFMTISRRNFLHSSAGAAGLVLAGRPAFAALTKPSEPVTLNIVDIAGNLALTQKAFDNYRKAKPDWVSKIIFSKAPAPELPGKLKAQQDANRVDIDMVLTGLDGVAAGVDQKLWIDLFPAHEADLPKLQSTLLEPAFRMQGLAQGQGLIVSYYPSGPLFEYAPERVKTVPKTAEELLTWAKTNPKKFMYARPANSGPGRTFLMGLPYILGDKDPKDPIKGWDKTWAYLKELGDTIDNYPSGTTPTMKALGEGSADIIVSTTGWDINPRVLGVVPKSAEIFTLANFRWVVDAHYMCVPKGVSAAKINVLLDLMNFLLTPQQQAYTFDEGYFYPGPAIKGVTIDMAPADSKAAIAEYGRPAYEKLIADHPTELPLDAGPMVAAFRRWDEEIGTRKAK